MSGRQAIHISSGIPRIERPARIKYTSRIRYAARVSDTSGIGNPARVSDASGIRNPPGISDAPWIGDASRIRWAIARGGNAFHWKGYSDRRDEHRREQHLREGTFHAFSLFRGIVRFG
jgi:hypothetical protein